MKIDQQRKLVYLLFGPFLVVIFASSFITWKYPDRFDYAMAGLGVCAVLLIALAIFMIRNKAT